MTTTPVVIAGATVAVCAEVPTVVRPGAFDGLAFVPIRGVRVAGSLVLQYQTAAFHAVGSAAPYMRRVARAPQTLQLELLRLVDPGQSMLRQAAAADKAYSYRVVLPRLGAHFFVARASGRSLSVGSAADLAGQTVTLELESPIIDPQ